MLEELLQITITRGASDLHLGASRAAIIRLHGNILKLDYPLLKDNEIWEWIQKIIPEYHKKEFEETNDTDFAYSLNGQNRFRVNLFRDHNGLGVVFRYIPDNLPTFEQISLEQGAQNLCELRKGMILVTGPTGSGKSTTLAAMIQFINENRAFHIITIEDPIEFLYPSKKSLIHQRELHLHTKTYHQALRTALRQDPDVILIGELRDIETTRLAIEAAETGHLVFGTLHTNTAYSTISRIINQFPEDEQELIRVMLADNLKGVICQNLLRKETSSGGRVAAREIWLYTVAGANLIRENKLHQIQSLIDGNQEMGMLSLNSSLSFLASQNIISPETALRNSMDPKDLVVRLSRLGFHIKE